MDLFGFKMVSTQFYLRSVCTIALILNLSVNLITGETFKLGYLTADKTRRYVKHKQGRVISGAMTWAIDTVNNDPDLLKGHNLTFMWSNTMADQLVGTRELTYQWRRGAIAFFGPEDSCDVESRVAASWNLPMISYKCADHRVSDKDLHPTFARTSPRPTQVTTAIIALLKHFNWEKFTTIVGSSGQWQSIAEKLKELALKHNFTINDRFDFTEPHTPDSAGYLNPFPTIVANSYENTRVYVFLGEHNGMVDMLSNLEERKLLDNGEYVLVYVDLGTLDNVDPLRYFKLTHDRPNLQRNVKAARSLLVIVASPATEEEAYQTFQRTVNFYNERPPFSFPNPFGAPKQITAYGAYLYDAVMLYARALDEVLKANGSATDGVAIIGRIRNRSFQSILGFLSHIDDNGDAEGNYTVLSRHLHSSPHSNYSMVSVGYFHHAGSQLPSFQLLANHNIDWVKGSPPLDEPPCGFHGELCLVPPNFTKEIALGVFGGILFIGAIISLVIYRNWRYEQEIAGLLWKISPVDIQGLTPGADKSGSRSTLATRCSFDSRISLAQIFTKTGSYKGQLVALKVYNNRSLDVSRNMKKEMKIMKDIRNDNVNPLIGAVVNIPDFILVTEYCSRGSLQDVLENDDITLDSMFVASLVFDLIKGMIYIHDSELGSHGNLKSSNCVVNSRWTLQVADYGLTELRLRNQTKEEHASFRDQLWTAPEILRKSVPHRRGTPKADVYAFGIILYEILGRAGPYGDCPLAPKEIIDRIKGVPLPPDKGFRPDLTSLDCQDYVLNCMRECWQEVPDFRPDFRSIRNRLKPMRQGMKTNIMDNMVEMMERYQTQLEDLVAERTEQLLEEQKKTERLLHRMLPKSVADQLVRGEAVVPEAFSAVTIYFSDICGFTAISAVSTPMEVVDLLNDLYTLFDSIIRNYDVYKVETIGDAYMVVSGLPLKNGDNHCGEIASMSLHLLTAIKTFRIRHKPDNMLKLRIGMHTGPTVAGVVGLTMPRYCLFGDTVNTASRMESNGLPLRIHASAESVEILDKLGGYTVESRGLVSLKGKGECYSFWLVDEDKSVRQARLQATAAVKCHGDTTQKQCCLNSEHRPLVHSASIDNPAAFGSVDSLGSKRRLSRDPERRLSPERGFFEIFKETDVSNRGSTRSASFHRRRSLDSRPRSREVSREVVNVNGCVANLSGGSHHRGMSLNEKSHPTVRSTITTQGGSQREMTRVPSIVVDSHQNEADVFTETDCLLDSGLCSEHSTKETSPEDLRITAIPISKDMNEFKLREKTKMDDIPKISETSIA